MTALNSETLAHISKDAYPKQDSTKVSSQDLLVIKIETSGMEDSFEQTVREVALMMQTNQFLSQDAKAKFVVKEMERRHGHDWACMVEPISKFVQCFGVSKRPDQYIRLTCGPDRLRLWRITDIDRH